jgi:DNA-binding protein YbaB
VTADRAAPGPPLLLTAEQARDAVATRSAQLGRRLEAVASAREQIAAVRARTTSDDGLVTVEVSARGTLLDLRLAPGATALTVDRLAALVLRTVRRASAGAAEQVRAVLEPAVAPGTDLDALVLDPAAPVQDGPEPVGAVDVPAVRRSEPTADEETGEPESWLHSAGARR